MCDGEQLYFKWANPTANMLEKVTYLDNDCNDGIKPVYDCENYGDQGITPGCKVTLFTPYNAFYVFYKNKNMLNYFYFYIFKTD